MHEHGAWMREALALAAQGAYTCKPNPQVGCVIVRDGTVVGRGFHAYTGQAHAEVHAINQAGDLARGATAYVTLEPCAHHGRTPPCADALIAAGIAHVEVAITDPFPAVAGRGIAMLRAAGITVNVGIEAEAARALNRGFLSRIERGRPWVRLKTAISLDGRTALANGQSQWITGAAAREDVQHWRARAGAILVGGATVRADNPRLAPRITAPCRAPSKWVLSARNSLPAAAALLITPGEVVLVSATAPTTLPAAVRHVGRVGHTSAAQFDALFATMAAEQINDVLVEAGPHLAGALLEADQVDEMLVYLAPKLLGDSGRALAQFNGPSDVNRAPQWALIDVTTVGEDVRLRYRRVRQQM